jgi:hypothetical protein
LTGSSLNNHEIFLLDDVKKIFIWTGNAHTGSPQTHAKAKFLAKFLNEEGGGNSEIEDIGKKKKHFRLKFFNFFFFCSFWV